MGQIDYFFPGKGADTSGPLARYSQPMPDNVVAAYIAAYTERGDAILDPFCLTGTMVREAIRAGRRAIAANFNPLNVVAVRGTLSPPPARELDAATARLGDSLKLGIPLREHINQLYGTTCPHCHQPAIADYFVWDREVGEPVEKHYYCPTCETDRLEAVDRSDLDALARIDRRGFHYWYVLERLAPAMDEDRALARKLLDLYTPRNLYALATLLIKIEMLFIGSPMQEALRLILLRCLDACSSLYASLEARTPPQRLRPLARFIEFNIWQAFERGYREMRQWSRPNVVRLAEGFEELLPLQGDDLPPQAREVAPNALVARASARQLAKRLPPETISLIIANPPRLDRVSSALSYLWSGWLFGRREAAALKPLLRRRPAIWSWYLKAMGATFRSLHRVLRPQGRLVLLFTTGELARCDALIMAAIGAGFQLETILYQPSDVSMPKEPLAGTKGEYRLHFVKGAEEEKVTPDVKRLAARVRRQVLKATWGVLKQRGEPLAFNWLHNAIYQRLSQKGLLRALMAVGDDERSRSIETAEGKTLANGLTARKQPIVELTGETIRDHRRDRSSKVDFLPLDFLTEQIASALEGGLKRDLVGFEDVGGEEGKRLPLLWWLKEPSFSPEPLSDRVEGAVHEALSETPSLSSTEIYRLFPGLLTPEPGLVEECLASYGNEDGSGRWQLRQGDRRERRELERTQMMARLVELGRRLGLQTTSRKLQKGGPDPGPLGLADVIWREEGYASHAFIVQWTATVTNVLLINRALKGVNGVPNCYIVIPEERADLIRFKAQRSPLFQRALIEGDWEFIKYSVLRRLIEEGEIARHDLKRIVGLEPIIEKPTAQLPLFWERGG